MTLADRNARYDRSFEKFLIRLAKELKITKKSDSEDLSLAQKYLEKIPDSDPLKFSKHDINHNPPKGFFLSLKG